MKRWDFFLLLLANESMEPSKNFLELCGTFRSDYVNSSVQDELLHTMEQREINTSYLPSGDYSVETIENHFNDVFKDKSNYLSAFAENKDDFTKFIKIFNEHIVYSNLGGINPEFKVYSYDTVNTKQTQQLLFHSYLAIFFMTFFYSDTSTVDKEASEYLKAVIRRVYRWPASARLLGILCQKFTKPIIDQLQTHDQMAILREIVLQTTSSTNTL